MSPLEGPGTHSVLGFPADTVTRFLMGRGEDRRGCRPIQGAPLCLVSQGRSAEVDFGERGVQGEPRNAGKRRVIADFGGAASF